MTCRTCGARCHGRFCKPCGRDEHRNQELYPDKQDDTPAEKILYECTECGGRYQAEGPGCPHCGYYGGRYAGDSAEEPQFITDGGRSIDDYADLGQLAGDGGQQLAETIEVVREDLEALRTSMQLAEKQLDSDDPNIHTNGHARVSDAIRRIETMLQGDDHDAN